MDLSAREIVFQRSGHRASYFVLMFDRLRRALTGAIGIFAHNTGCNISETGFKFQGFQIHDVRTHCVNI